MSTTQSALQRLQWPVSDAVRCTLGMARDNTMLTADAQ